MIRPSTLACAALVCFGFPLLASCGEEADPPASPGQLPMPEVPVGGSPGAGAPMGGAGAAPAAGGSGGDGTGGAPLVPSTGGGPPGNGGTSPAAGGASDGGSGGAPETGSGFSCPADIGSLSLDGAAAVEISDALPMDSFGQGFSILEGPVWTGDALYFSQIAGGEGPPPSRLLKVVPGSPGVVFLADAGSNGLALDPQGQLLAAMHKDGSISRVDLIDKSVTAIAGMHAGARFNSPNDIAVRKDGTLYFSDPSYQAPMPTPQMSTRVYQVDPAGTVSVAVEGLQQPNGVTLSLDEAALYVSGQGPVQKYAVNADGSLGAGAQFGNVFQADGMVIDCAGNLYVANNANVTVLDPAGQELGSFMISGAQATTNLAFGGPEGKTLFITSLDSAPKLFQVELGIVGYPF